MTTYARIDFARTHEYNSACDEGFQTDSNTLLFKPVELNLGAILGNPHHNIGNLGSSQLV